VNFPALLFVLRGSFIETWAQARAAGILATLGVVTALATAFCLSVSVRGATEPLPTLPWENPEYLPLREADRIGLGPAGVRNEGVDVPTGEVSLLFGAVVFPITRTTGHAVGMIQSVLAVGIADTLGVLLALLWTSGFLPHFLQPASATVMFSKPAPRGLILIAKTFAVVVTVGAYAVAFIFATWLALGLRSGHWDVRYFLAAPVLVIHFAAFFAVSALIAVWTRKIVACALGTLAFWLACSAVNLSRHETLLQTSGVPTWLNGPYWILPKPLDGHLLLAGILGVDESFRTAFDIRRLTELGFAPELSVASALPFTAAVLYWAARSLSRTDY
jgi:hypothetical protein